MASEWATSKAIKVWPESQWYLRLGRDGDIERIAAALDEAPELLAENEELMEAHQALGHEYEMLARERDKLQADLDAALELCKEFGVAYIRQPEHETIEVLSRVQALLAERAVKHGE